MTHEPWQRPVHSRPRQHRRRTKVMGVDKKAMGKADATSCHAMEATMVVMRAPSNPVSKNFWVKSATPKMLSSPSLSLTVVTRAMMKKHRVTHICRPIMKPGKLRPSPSKRRSQVFLAQEDLERSSSVIRATAKKAICIPSSIPTIDMKKKKRMIVSQLGTPSHMVVCPLKRAYNVTAKAKARMVVERRTRAQKKMFWTTVRGASFETRGWPAAQAKNIWTG
mmetsp:Transcript_12142/g.25063  ORF Transcript_12142/g.25063 Transcript_12142/m.25063 type:complete len:222 (+) Transcript_12142:504-1169(+)